MSEPSAAAGHKLLIAEDNPVNQEAIRRILERRGYRVTLAGDGREVVAKAAAETFDVIFMDVQMPELDGYQATAEIRKAEKGGRTPIVAMTANAMAGDKEKCLAAGMDDYISKPIQRQQLFDLLDRLLAGKTPTAPVAAAAPSQVLDKAALMDNLGDDKQLLGDLLAVFAKNRVAHLETIRRAIVKQDAAGLEKSAHKLAGTLGTFFATAAFGAAKALEAMGKENRLHTAPEAYFELERRLEAFDLAIAEVAKT